MLPTTHFLRHHPAGIAAVATGTVAVIAVTVYLRLRPKPTAEELELLRRAKLTEFGRTIDGTLIDTAPEIPPEMDTQVEPPRAIIYRYSVAGVTYECGQDVSSLASHLPDLSPASGVFGLPVQVRYDRENPASSIVVSETWNGLWDQNPAHGSPAR